MDDKLKRRLAGAAVLLLAAFAVVSMLPTPEQAAQPADADVVTIPLHEVANAEPPPPPPSAAATPATIAAPADAGEDGGGSGETAGETVISGDDDAGAEPGDARKPETLALDDASSRAAPPAAQPVAAPPAATGSATPPKAVGKAETPAIAPKPAAGKPAPSVAAEVKSAETKPAVPLAKPAPTKPAATPAPAASDSWFVQVGGFADIGNARQVQARLQSLGQPSILSPTETSKGTLYRVRAGPYAGREPAQAALGKLSGNGYPDAKLVAP